VAGEHVKLANDENQRCPFYRDRDACQLEVGRNKHLSGAAKSVASELLFEHSNRKAYLQSSRRVAWPSMDLLAETLGYDRSTIIKAIGELETHGHIQVTRPEKKGRGKGNGYRFLVQGRKNGCEKTTIKNGSEETTIKRRNGRVLASKKVTEKPPEPYEEPLEGAGARSRAPQAPVQDEDQALDLIEDEEGKNGDFVARDGDKSPSTLAISSGQERPTNHASECEESWPEIDPEDCDISNIPDASPPNEIADQWAEADGFQEAPDLTEGMPDEWQDEEVQDTAQDDALYWNHVAFSVVGACPMIETPADLLAVVAIPLGAWRGEFREHLPRAIAMVFAEAPAARAGAVRHLRREVARLLDGDEREADWVVNGLLNKVDALPPAKPIAPIKPRHPELEEAANG
jgi:biotin operon repressor